MENSELIKIAITAIISVAAKEVLTWAASKIKSLSIGPRVKAKFKSLFNVVDLIIFLDVVLIIVGFWQLSGYVSDPSPLKRFDVAAIAYWVVFVCQRLYVFPDHISIWRKTRKGTWEKDAA